MANHATSIVAYESHHSCMVEMSEDLSLIAFPRRSLLIESASISRCTIMLEVLTDVHRRCNGRMAGIDHMYRSLHASNLPNESAATPIEVALQARPLPGSQP